ncbi:MAG: Fe(3+)-hydroxamate ABC transporter permease FhuB [Rhodobacteraceae bacterium]|nr:Fe(3+)-hydroxamate ABC transporter permease FhuB [Paracoccaceae bacterium]MBR9823512.1 Fe(3+)-hydroxamate ABC transporter permease FhuB [Paracoccaceae bacterium]
MRRLALWGPLAGLLALSLWMLAAVQQLPLADWPVVPYDPAGMTLDQILLAFGAMPRGMVALLVGAALGLAGALMQAVLRNPLADPTTLGLQAGAQLALVAATLLAPGLLAFGRGPVALAGAALASGTVLALAARRGFAPVTVTISGMLVGLLCAAIATALTLSRGEYLLSLVIWNGGALTQQDWSGAAILAAVLLPALALALLMARPLLLLSLGGEGARALGLPAMPLRLAALAVAVVLSATVAAEVGLVGFVGLAAPAIARRLGARTIRQRLLLATLAGALLLSLTDSALMLLAAAGGPVLPSGALTGLIGGPLLIALLPRLRATVPPETEAGDRPAPRARHPRRVLLVLAVLLPVLSLATLMAGRGLGGWGLLDPALRETFLPLRATALLASLAAGALLAGSGAILQKLTANPLAAPEVLGVTGGASLGYASAIFALPSPGALELALGAGGGAALALLALSAYALRAEMAPARLLLAGLAIGALSSAVLAAIMASGDMRAWAVLGWLSGSAARATPLGAAALTVLALLLAAGGMLAGRWLQILPLGGAVAGALGVPVTAVRLALILGAGLATGAASVLVGPVSFIGLMAPHIARSLGLTRPRDFLAGAMLTGALLMGLAAFGARSLAYPYDLPLGLFATLIGAPWLFAGLMRRT